MFIEIIDEKFGKGTYVESRSLINLDSVSKITFVKKRDVSDKGKVPVTKEMIEEAENRGLLEEKIVLYDYSSKVMWEIKKTDFTSKDFDVIKSFLIKELTPEKSIRLEKTIDFEGKSVEHPF